MKIAVFETKPRDVKFFTKRFGKKNLVFETEPLTIKNAEKYKNIDVACTFIYSEVDKKALAKMPKLKLVATRSTGFDHIDVKECQKKNILVANVPTYGENTVAEHTFALILALSRKVHKSYIRTLKNDFSIQGMQGFDLMGKTIGVIGAGHIGLHVIRIAKGFGMHVLAYDMHKDKFMADVLHYKYTDNLDEIYKNCDIISLHVPLFPSTKHMIDKKAISKMKKDVMIINTARGELINTDDLYDGLKSGKIGGAGLDVIEGEDVIKEDKELLHNETNPEKLRQIFQDQELFHMDNVVFTPHNAFNSTEALGRILETTGENIAGFIAGKPLNLVQAR